MSEIITKVSTDILQVHPRNTEFYDDITGEDYERFKGSIRDNGLLSPILVSPDMTVISGHQRLKACKELGIKLVPVMIKEDLTDENEKLKLLLVANFGRTKNDEAKQRKIVVEYVNLCGYKHGEIGVGRKTSDNQMSIPEIAKQLNVSVSTLHEMLAIERKLTPEVKQLLKDGVFTKTTASKVLVKLSPQEQAELIAALPQDIVNTLTQKQVQSYIDQIKTKDNKISGYEMKLKQSEQEKASLREELKQERQKEPETIIKEVVPDDYDMYRKNNEWLNKEYQKRCAENTELKNELHALREDSARENLRERLENDCIFFCARCDDFLKGVGGYAYLADKLNELPDMERRSYKKAIEAMNAWSENILATMNEVKMMN